VKSRKIERFELRKGTVKTNTLEIHEIRKRLGQRPRLLISRPDNIGDVIITGPALRAIKTALPEAYLTLLVSPGGAQAAPLLPWVDEVIAARTLWQDLGHLPFEPAREWELASRLEAGSFDAAFILTSFNQSPHAPAFLCALAGISIRLGESKEEGQGVLTHAAPSLPDEVHQAERNLQLIEAAGFEVSDRRLSVATSPDARSGVAMHLAAHGIGPGDGYLLLCPWASCPARTYFPERFALASRLLAETTGWPVVVAGAPRDRERSRTLLAILEEWGVDLVGETSVSELAALVADAKLVLANDSLPMHLADACSTPSVILYSGTEYESQWQPRYSPTRILRRPTPCSPCYAFTCPYSLECLDFPSETVADAGLGLLREVGAV
jgi:ADP-heptose:LPS heptosyltransferase